MVRGYQGLVLPRFGIIIAQLPHAFFSSSRQIKCENTPRISINPVLVFLIALQEWRTLSCLRPVSRLPGRSYQ